MSSSEKEDGLLTTENDTFNGYVRVNSEYKKKHTIQVCCAYFISIVIHILTTVVNIVVFVCIIPIIYVVITI